MSANPAGGCTRRPAREGLLPLLVFLLPLAVYPRTMAPTVCSHDSAELVTGAWTLGIVHPPGCPAYLLLARVFCFMPFGDPAWRVNLLSAVSAAAAVTFAYLLARRWGCPAGLAVAGAWWFAFSRAFWPWALVAELYAPSTCLAAAVLWLVFRWTDEHRRRDLWLAGGIFGAGLGVHTSLVLLLPALAWLVLTDPTRSRRRPSQMAGPVLLGMLSALAVFLYLPLRHGAAPAADWLRDTGAAIDPGSAGGLWWMIRGGPFARLFFSVPWRDVASRCSGFALQLFANFGVIGVVAGVLGFVSGYETRPRGRRTTALLLVFLFYSGFFLTYRIYDWEWMFSVSHMLWGIAAAGGLSAVARSFPLPHRGAASRWVTAVGLLLAGGMLWSNGPDVDRSGDRAARRAGERILAEAPPDAVLTVRWRMFHVARYLQLVEGLRPDVTLRRENDADRRAPMDN